MGALYLALLFLSGGPVVGNERMGSLAGGRDGVNAVHRRAAPVGAVLRHVATRNREERVYGPRLSGN